MSLPVTRTSRMGLGDPMSEQFSPEEIERFDTIRLALFIDYQEAGRPAVVAGLLAKTIIPLTAGLPANVTQFATQKELAEGLKKAAEHEPDSSLLVGIAAIAKVLADKAIDPGQREYWTEIMGDATLAWAELSDEPEPAPNQVISSRVQPPGMGWNPDVVPHDASPLVRLTAAQILGHALGSVETLRKQRSLQKLLGRRFSKRLSDTGHRLVQEFIIFQLHVAGRIAFATLGRDRDLVMDELLTVLRSMTPLTRGPDFNRLYNDRMTSYTEFEVPKPEDPATTGLFYEAGKLIYLELAPGTFVLYVILPGMLQASTASLRDFQRGLTRTQEKGS